MVPELEHLKAAEDQASLIRLLDKIGAKTVEVAEKTPNIISHETVVTEVGGIKTHKDYSYLVVQHAAGAGLKGFVLNEYRRPVEVVQGRAGGALDGRQREAGGLRIRFEDLVGDGRLDVGGGQGVADGIVQLPGETVTGRRRGRPPLRRRRAVRSGRARGGAPPGGAFSAA